MRVGVIGCGVIATRYVADSSAFETWQPIACADLDPASATAFASEHDLRAESVDELLGDPDVELVLNLTPPAAHRLAESVRACRGEARLLRRSPLAVSVSEGRARSSPRLGRLGLRARLRAGHLPRRRLPGR